MGGLRRILIIDTETSGLDPAKDHLLEVGMISWSVVHRTTIASYSFLVAAPGNAAEEINGIPAAVLGLGYSPYRVREEVMPWAASVDAIVAHNGDFDRQWLPRELDGVPWIDTAWDVAWPRSVSAGSGKLVALCLAHGVGVATAHRALADCQLIARLFERVAELGHDVGAMLERGLRPKVKVLSLAPFEQKDIVKQHGFRWSPEQKVWWRMMPAEDLAALPFRTRVAG